MGGGSGGGWKQSPSSLFVYQKTNVQTATQKPVPDVVIRLPSRDDMSCVGDTDITKVACSWVKKRTRKMCQRIDHVNTWYCNCYDSSKNLGSQSAHEKRTVRKSHFIALREGGAPLNKRDYFLICLRI